MAQEGTYDDAAHRSDPVEPSGSAAVTTATTDSTAALLNRITVLEGREHALNVALVMLRAELDRLRRNLHQVPSVPNTTPPVLERTPLKAVVPAAPLTTDQGPSSGSEPLQERIQLPRPEPGPALAERHSSDGAFLEQATKTGDAPAISELGSSASGTQSRIDPKDGLLELEFSDPAAEPASPPEVDGITLPPDPPELLEADPASTGDMPVEEPAVAEGQDERLDSGEQMERFGTYEGSPEGGLHSPSSSLESSGIDDLIREAVASREHEMDFPRQLSRHPADAAAFPAITETQQAPALEHGDTTDEEKAPSLGGAGDFFIRPNSSRRGRG